jgi:Carboxypeptidase regulatory-like domain/TonB dependent receptor/TonB-dependent Receptor Plug Domain
MTGRGRSSLLAVLAVTIVAGTARAQVEQGAITGRVFDEGGGVVPGATVRVTSIATGVAREAVTNAGGQYTVPYLSVGMYEVTATLSGFSVVRVTDIAIRVGLTATVDLVLKAGPVQAEVTVTANAVQLELQSQSVGTVITGRQMIELPLVGRNPYALVTLAPGVVDRGNTGTGPLINGARSNSTAVLLDGAEQRNSTTNDLNYSPPLESVEEFKVVTNGLSAEFGRTGGGIVTAATRSGTNALHGSAYGYIRNDKFNANSWTNKRNKVPRGKEDIRQWGFTLGGPIEKNRTFFFVNLERSKSLTPDNLIRTVPTLLQRAGDFSQTRTSAGQMIVIYDPATTRPAPAGGFVRDPFPGNVIPPGRIDPIAKALLEYYPLPTNGNPTQNFVAERSRTSTVLPLVVRVDHNAGRHRLFGSFRQSNSEDNSPTVSVAFPDPGTNGEFGTRANDRLSAVLSDTVVFGSSLVAEIRWGYTRSHFTTAPATLGLDFATLGIGSADSALKTHSAVAMFPRIEVGGGIDPLGMNRAGLIDDLEGTRELQAHATWVRNTHTIKGGFQFARMGFDVFRPEYPSGQYVFGPGFTQGPNPATASTSGGFGFATFLLGAPTGGQITGDPRFRAAQRYVAPYIQDDWRITNALTVNLGIRYEYQTPWSERDNQLTFFDTDATDPLTGRRGVVSLVGLNGGSDYQTHPDRNNVAPRLGFAWRVVESSVLRGGYGIVYYPGSGGIGSAPSDLGGGGFLTSTGVNLVGAGTPPAAPNTPPSGASLRSPFNSGYFEPPATVVGGTVTTAFRDLQTPFAHTWNVGFQRELPGRMIGEIAYVGTRHKNIWINLPRNAIPSEALSQGTGLDALVPNPFFGIIRTGDALLTAASTRASQLLKPYPHYAGIVRFRDSVGDSWYRGLTIRLEKRAAKGIAYQLAYTLSREEDTVPERFGSRGSAIVDPNDLRKSRAVAEDDRTHVVASYFIWELPFGPGQRWAGRGWMANVVGGWRLGGVGALASGRPLVVSGVTASNGVSTGLGAHANVVGNPALSAGEVTLDRWFNTAAFTQPAAFTFGTGTRTYPQVRGSRIRRLDILLSRLQRVGTSSVEFRVEAQNALNSPQFGEPVGNLIDPNFGSIITGIGERRLQLGLRFGF